MSISELRREVLLLRAKRWPLVVLALLLPAQLALVWLLRAPARERLVYETRSDIVLVPSVVTYERVVNVPAQRAACPPERSDAPRVQPAQPPELVDRVRPSETNAGWIAAWNTETIFISRDAGASWTRALDGDGPVRDVAFDCYGNAIAVRGAHLGSTRDNTWRPLPQIDLRDRSPDNGDEWSHDAEVVIVGGGPDIAIVGHVPFGDEPDWRARLIVSRDGGDTFLVRDFADSSWQTGTIAGRQHADGSIVGMVPQSDCGGDSPWMFRFENDTVTDFYAGTSAELEIFGDLIVAEDGWQRIGSDETAPIEGVEGNVTVLAGPHPILVDANNKLYRFAHGTAKPLPWNLSGDPRGASVDRSGRVWSIACGTTLHIATRAAAPLCEGD
jgi:hypothetical protein